MAKELRLIYAEAADSHRQSYMKKNPLADSHTYAMAFSDGWGAAIIAGMTEEKVIVETFIKEENQALLQFGLSVKQMAVDGTNTAELGDFCKKWLEKNYPSRRGGGI
jgi:hypothetical protein